MPLKKVKEVKEAPARLTREPPKVQRLFQGLGLLSALSFVQQKRLVHLTAR